MGAIRYNYQHHLGKERIAAASVRNKKKYQVVRRTTMSQYLVVRQHFWLSDTWYFGVLFVWSHVSCTCAYPESRHDIPLVKTASLPAESNLRLSKPESKIHEPRNLLFWSVRWSTKHFHVVQRLICHAIHPHPWHASLYPHPTPSLHHSPISSHFVWYSYWNR